MRRLINGLIDLLTEAYAPYAVVDCDGNTYYCWTWAGALSWVAACDARAFGTVSVWKGYFNPQRIAAQS